MGTNRKAVGNNLVELSKRCDCQRKEINHLMDQEEEWRGEIVGVNHDLKLFKARLERAEESRHRCGKTPSDMKNLVSQEEAHSELSFTNEYKENECFAPPKEILIPIPVLPPYAQEHSMMIHPPLEEIVEEPREPIAEDLDALLREADEGRTRDLQEGSSHSVVHPPPRVGSEMWRRLNGIH